MLRAMLAVGLCLAVLGGMAEAGTAPGNGKTVVVVVKDTLLPEISAEVSRLCSDLVTDGYVAKTKSFSGTALDLWTYLKGEYTTTGQTLAGAILIGNLPTAKNLSSNETTDLCYWNMTTFQDTSLRHIWVSRMGALSSSGAGLLDGEVASLKRALQANHDYRAGSHRLPYTAYFVMNAYPEYESYYYPNEGANALAVWPNVVEMLPEAAITAGGELVDETMHGPSLSTRLSGRKNHPSQVRFCLFTSCGTGAIGSCVNQNLLTYAGGNVLSVGASATTYTGAFTMLQNSTVDANLRSALAGGKSWGESLISNYGFDDRYRAMFYGDLSLDVKAASANAVPTVSSLTASKTSGTAPLAVSFTAAASDADGSIASYDWYLKSFNYGFSAPDASGATKTSASVTYTVPHRYLAEVEAVDNYKARAWKELAVAVAPEPGKPVRVNCGYSQSYYTPGLDYTDGAGDLWLHDQAVATGTWGYSGGSVAVSTAAVNATADDVLYQSYRNQTSFTYKVPLACGSYVLRLGFADMASSAAGVRIMDIDVEGATVISGLDVYAQAGPKTAMQVQLPVLVLDGELTLVVKKNAAATANAFLNCFEILIPDPTDNWPSVSSSSPGSPLTMAAGSSQTFNVEAWDPDGDNLAYRWKIDGATVPVTGDSMTYSPTAADGGLHNIEVLIDDGRGGIARQSWDVTVTAPTVTLSVSDAWASEPSTDKGSFKLTRTGATTAALTVKYAMSGTATNGTDYQTLGGSAVIPAGSTYVTVYATPVDDTLVEGKEFVTMTLSANSAYTLGATKTGTVNLLDNEQPVVTTSVSDSWASEPGTDTGRFKITRTGATTATLTVSYTMSGTSANGTDYISLPGSATIAAGSTYAYVDVLPKDDTTVENKETVILTVIDGSGYQTGSTVAGTVTLLDNEMPIITVAATDAVAAEPSDAGVFTITRGGKTDAAVTVNYTMSGTATKGTDYSTPTGSVTLAAGVTSTTVPILPINDTTAENRESVTLAVAANSAYQTGAVTSATLYLYDDEKPYVTVAATDAAAAETGSDIGKFIVTCVPAPKAATTIVYTMSGTATNGTDYASLSGSVTVAAGATTAVVTLTPVDDAVYEGTESAKLTVSTGTTYQVGSPSYATVNITDNEPTVSVSRTDSSAAETSAGVTANTGCFRITRSNGLTTSALTVSYTMSGTATNGTDYNSLPGSATIPAGLAYVDILVTPKDDTLVEGAETVIMTIPSSSAYKLGTASATVTLNDND